MSGKRKEKKRKQVVVNYNYPDLSHKVYITVDLEDSEEQEKELERLRREIAELNMRYENSRLYSERLNEVALRKSILQIIRGIERKEGHKEPVKAELG